jgi:hypothetical protein
MPYDEQLAARVRNRLGGAVEEKDMFGGRAFLFGGNLAVCASHDGGLLVRVEAADQAGLLDADVEPMVMAGRVSRTWVRVDAPALAGDRLAGWVDRGVATATALPPKPGR